jgi:hypothetical protein
MHTTACWLVPPAEVVNRYDRDALDGALIGLARVARTTGSLLTRPARPWRAAQVQAPVHRSPHLSTCTTPCRAGGPDRAALHPTDDLIRCLPRGVDGYLCRWLPACVGPASRSGRAARPSSPELLAASGLSDAHPRRSPDGDAGRAGKPRTPRPPEPSPPTAPRSSPAGSGRGSRSRARRRGGGAERRVPLPPATVARLAVLPAACYFDTETTASRPAPGPGGLPRRLLGHLEGDHLAVRQLLLPTTRTRRALLRLAAGELAELPRGHLQRARLDLPPLITPDGAPPLPGDGCVAGRP